MNRQLLTAALATMSTLSLVAPQFTNLVAAQVISAPGHYNRTEKEPNPQEKPEYLGTFAPKTSVHIKGSLGRPLSGNGAQIDRSDHFEFYVPKTGQYTVAMGGVPSRQARLFLYHIHTNGQTLIANHSTGQPILKNLTPSRYRVEVFYEPHAKQPIDYTLILAAQ